MQATEAERVNTAWERIEKWYSQNLPEYQLLSGATAEDIQALETHLSLTLPEGLKTSLRRHNGVGYAKWPRKLLLCVNEIKSEWDVWNETETPDEIEEDPEEKRQAVYWCPSWVPIDVGDDGNGSCVDLKPGKNGTMGQVIRMDHEEGPSGPMFADYPAYLEDIASELEAGKYKNNKGYLAEEY